MLEKLKIYEAGSGTKKDEDRLWQAIESTIDKQRRRKVIFYFGVTTGIAASVLWGWFYFKSIQIDSPVVDREYMFSLLSEKELLQKENITFETIGKQEIDIDGNPLIKHTPVGIEIESEDKNQVVDSRKGNDLLKIVVPKGKRGEVVLPDGSKVKINSGTQVLYPAEFTGKCREIYVSGEVFLEVAKDPDRPFIVKTKKFDVDVLGTVFNVCAYEDEKEANVLLVSGRVMIKTSKESIQLIPNEKQSICEGELGVKETVIPEELLGWIDGRLFFKAKPILDVFALLERYYGREIIVEDELPAFYVTGKMDLRENIEEVIRILSLTFPIDYKIDNNQIVIVYKRE